MGMVLVVGLMAGCTVSSSPSPGAEPAQSIDLGVDVRVIAISADASAVAYLSGDNLCRQTIDPGGEPRCVVVEPKRVYPVNWSQSTWPRANHPIVFDNASTLNNPYLVDFEARTATEQALPAGIEWATAIGWVAEQELLIRSPTN